MTLSLKLIQNHEWSLHGPLNVFTIKSLWQQGHHWIDKTHEKQINLDLRDISAPDSTSVALLLDWIRYAKKQNKAILLHHIPQKMQEIIKLSNLQEIFTAK